MSDLAVGTGLATGIDYTSLIANLMKLERLPETVLQTKQANINKKINAMQAVLDKLSSLKTLASGMNTPETFSGKTVDVTDESAVKATAGSSALQGIHQIKVTTLAQSQIQASTGYASKTDTSAFAAGSFIISSSKPGSTPVTVTLAQSTSLEGLASAINSAKAGVTASVVNDGSGTPYRLVVSGTESYTSAFDFTGYADPLSLSETQQAQMATFSVDGISMTKASNTVSDAIPGVSFTLLQGPAAGSPVGTTKDFNLTVGNDAEGVKEKIKNFVTAYNSIMYEIKGQSDFNTSTKAGGVLSGDSTLRTIQSQLQNIVTTRVSGLTGSYGILSEIGISTQKDGSLKIDDTRLSDALDNNFNDVVALFTSNGGVSGLSNDEYGVAEQFNRVLKKLAGGYIGPASTENGIAASSINGWKKSVSDIDDQIEAMELRLDKKEEMLRKQFAAMETLVSSIQSQGNSMISSLSSMSSWLY